MVSIIDSDMTPLAT